jgi:hypothetical protein
MRVRSPSRKLRVAVENQFGDPVVEDRVAEKFEASVRFVRVRHAGVGQ